MSVNLGTDTFGRGVQIADRLRARGKQHALLGRSARMGTTCQLGLFNYERSMSLSQRLISRGKGMENFKSQISGLSGDRPWYEAFFEHIENVAPVASQLVLQIYDMRYDQQRAAWQQASTDKREAAYMDMFKSMVSQKQTGQGTINPQTQQFLINQFQGESSANQQQIAMQAAGGNQAVAQQILSLTKPWYEKPIVLLGLGGAALLGMGMFATLVFAMKD